MFVTSDFSDIADNNTVRQNMLRFVNDGILRRIMGGIFEKPKYSKLLGEYVAADPDAVAKALARRYHWTIAPCGTQLSICWVFRRRLRRFGPYRTYEWNATRLEFKHRTNREITGLSYMTALLIQALKTLGKENVTQDTIEMLSGKLSHEEKAATIKEASESTDWVYQYIKQICEEKGA